MKPSNLTIFKKDKFYKAVTDLIKSQDEGEVIILNWSYLKDKYGKTIGETEDGGVPTKAFVYPTIDNAYAVGLALEQMGSYIKDHSEELQEELDNREE